MNQPTHAVDVTLPVRRTPPAGGFVIQLQRLGRRLALILIASWKFLLGALFTQSILGAILVVGWIFRFMQRTTWKAWWRISPDYNRESPFTDWLRKRDPLHPQLHPPHWILRNNFIAVLRRSSGESNWSRFRLLVASLTDSFRSNLRLGLAGVFNAWTLTLPGCVLMLFSWYDGWNNSFNKGYEQAPVGPVTGLLGIFLFILAMLYVPMAQARQAATGEWRSFYQFSLVWHLVRRAWPGCLLLALGFSLVSLPLTILKTAPYYLSHSHDAIAQFTPEQALGYLNGYFFACGFALFAGWLLLRWMSARLYARHLLRALQKGEIHVAQLAASERETLSHMGLIQIHPPRSRHVLLRVATGTSASLLTFLGLGLTGLVWFTFIAQVYVSEFLHYHPFVAWVNQPLAQLPWFRYIPPQIQNPFGELALTALVLVLGFGGAGFLGKIRSVARPKPTPFSGNVA